VPRCTIERDRTHATEGFAVLYPWDPWLGRAAYMHEVIERDGERAFRCELGRVTDRTVHEYSGLDASIAESDTRDRRAVATEFWRRFAG